MVTFQELNCHIAVINIFDTERDKKKRMFVVIDNQVRHQRCNINICILSKLLKVSFRIRKRERNHHQKRQQLPHDDVCILSIYIISHKNRFTNFLTYNHSFIHRTSMNFPTLCYFQINQSA
mmetsp:Transcript_18117/g.25901  ORF Transcript_18117/g.25901 Transcript_18117/m.25901 type:complete len:121 (-) Transcript_18117:2293-2655(-)